jgi:hypothetical protein
MCLTNSALHHERIWGSGCIDPYFLDLSTSWRWVVSFTAQPLYPVERAPGTHWIEGWVDLRAGLDNMEKRIFLTLPSPELRPLCCPASSQLLYWLSYCCGDEINLNTARNGSWAIQLVAHRYTGSALLTPPFPITLLKIYFTHYIIPHWLKVTMILFFH